MKSLFSHRFNLNLCTHRLIPNLKKCNYRMIPFKKVSVPRLQNRHFCEKNSMEGLVKNKEHLKFAEERSIPIHRPSRQEREQKKRDQEKMKRKRAVNRALSPDDPIEGGIYFNKELESDLTKKSYSGDIQQNLLAYNFNETPLQPGPPSDLEIRSNMTDEQQIEAIKEEFHRRGENLDHYAIGCVLDDEEKNPKEKSKIIFELSKNLSNEGFHEDAVHFLKTCIILDPENIEAIKTRAELNSQLEHLEEAIDDYLQLLKFQPEIEFAVARLGLLYAQQEKYNKARSLIQWFRSQNKKPETNVEIDMIYSHINSILGDNDQFIVDTSGFRDGYYDSLTSGFPIEVKMTENKGRGLFATQTLEQGDRIFMDVPLVTTPLASPVASQICSHCFRPLKDIEWIETSESSSLEDLKQQMSSSDFEQIEEALREQEQLLKRPQTSSCKKCQEPHYCSPECATQDSELIHSVLCRGSVRKPNPKITPLLKAIKEEGAGGEQTMFLTRLFGLLELERIGKAKQPVWDHLKRLYYNRAASVHPERALGLVETEHLKLLHAAFPKLVNLENYLRFRSVIHLNSLTLATHGIGMFGKIEGSDLKVDSTVITYECAAGLFPIVSYLNHSCAANVEMEAPLLNGIGQISFIARRAIQKGEELTWNYASSIADPIFRREHLMEKYGFKCNCPVCLQVQKDLEAEKPITKPDIEAEKKRQAEMYQQFTSGAYKTSQIHIHDLDQQNSTEE